jgi:hypothetical protein
LLEIVMAILMCYLALKFYFLGCENAAPTPDPYTVPSEFMPPRWMDIAQVWHGAVLAVLQAAHSLLRSKHVIQTTLIIGYNTRSDFAVFDILIHHQVGLLRGYSHKWEKRSL